ncbi:MAG: FIVAR domain-containing protein [Firmicutes bacterium]|nr:FIVAR domain-containing protein [Bacillota bacterium]
MRKWLISLLSVCCLVMALGAAAPVFAEDVSEVGDAQALAEAVSTGGSIILTDDIVLDTHLEIGAGIEVSLNLNGKTLSANTADTVSAGGVFLVSEGAVLSLRNGTVSGGSASENGGGIYNAGTVNLENVTVSGNSAGSAGGGIYSAGTMSVRGLVTVQNNTGETADHPDNVYLPSGKAIGVTGQIDSASRIGVTIQTEAAQITSGYGDYANIRDGHTIFLSDKDTLVGSSDYTDDGSNYEVFFSTPVPYLDRSFDASSKETYETLKTRARYKTVSSGDTIWDDGWYYVSQDTTLKQRVETRGHVNLIVADGVTLTAKKGIYVNLYTGATQDGTLTVYSQKEGSGKIIATGDDSAGIGCIEEDNAISGSVIIKGCTIEATGDSKAAGIGGCEDGGYSDIVIYGGTVTATAGIDGAGIGGGKNSKKSGSVTIYSGTVTTLGGTDGAGIGGGYGDDGIDVSIYGGTVKATAGQGGVTYGVSAGGAGIGGGYSGNGGTVNVYGGDVNATAGKCAAGIGGGAPIINGGSGSPRHVTGAGGGTLNVYGGKVIAKGGTSTSGGGAGIGCGYSSMKKGGTVNVSGGYVESYGGYDACGIGGSKLEGWGADVRITGGTVIAQANPGQDGVAIGSDFGNFANPGTLEISSGIRVFTGDNAEQAASAGAAKSADRVSRAGRAKYARIEACDHNGENVTFTYTQIDGSRHSRLCSACGEEFEETHSYGSDGNCACGDGEDVAKHKIIIDMNRTDDGSDVTEAAMVAHGRTYVLPDPSSSKWFSKLFLGWIVTGQDGLRPETEQKAKPYHPGDEVQVAADLTLTAVWAEGRSISFEANGGEGSRSDVIVAAGSDYSVPDEDGFTAPENKEFTGWKVSIDGKPVTQESGEETIFLPGDTFKVTGDAVLTAQWDIGWTALRNYLAKAPDDTNYQLQIDISNINADDPLEIPAGKSLTIDLNGHTLDAASPGGRYDYAFLVKGSLTIIDSSKAGSGQITGASGPAIWLQGGTEESPASFTMEGGTIADCGGGIDARSGSGTITLNEGRICGCTKDEAIHINSESSFTMNGGSIEDNITSTSSTVFVDGGTFIMNGGSITGNTAAKAGGVYLENGRFTMNGGSITKNTASSSYPYAGGVYVGEPTSNPKTSPVFTISGSVRIENNIAIESGLDGSEETKTADNVHLSKNAVIHISDADGSALSEDSVIGVTTKVEPTAGNPIAITSGLSGRGSLASLKSDDSLYFVQENGADHEAALVLGTVIRFDKGEGSGSMKPISVPPGTKYELPEPAFSEPEGKVFIGWQVGDDTSVLKQPKETIDVSEDAEEITLYAMYDMHKHVMSEVKAHEATCTEEGFNVDCWRCKICGNYFSDEAGLTELDESQVLSPTGHDWMDPEYTWSTDSHTVTAVLTCKNDPSLKHGISETVEAKEEVITPSDCATQTSGVSTFTAVFKNEHFKTQTKENVEVAPTHANLKHFAAADATRTKDGNLEYWYCTKCERHFKDRAATEEFTEDEWIIPATGDSQEMKDAVTAAQAVLSEVEGLKADDYTAASYAAVTASADSLKTVLNEDTATADQIKTAAQTLRSAIDGLKMTQKLTVKKKTVKVKLKKVRKKKQTVKPLTVKGQKTTVTYKGKPIGKKAKKALKINKKTGKITVKKKTKKGKYKMKVTVTAAGSAKYAAASKTVTVTIKVK